MKSQKMNNLDYQYQWLLKKIKEDGTIKEGRNGTTRSIFGYQFRHNMREGFPLLTTKKMYWKGIVSELLWFLSGSTNIQSLVKQGNYIWVGDAYKHYKTVYHLEKDETSSSLGEKLLWDLHMLKSMTEEEFIEEIKTNDEFALRWGDMGPIYGKQWRDWSGIDQIQNLLDTLRTQPDSRRMLVSAWNVGELEDMKLPPCHYGFQVWTRELTIVERIFLDTNELKLDAEEYLQEHSEEELHKELDKIGVPKRGISLMWNQRSVDTPLGFPFNIASYGLLLVMIADEMNMVPLELIANLGDVHIYENQMEGVEEQVNRKSHPLPTVKLEDGIYSTSTDIHLENYVSEGKINFPLSN